MIWAPGTGWVASIRWRSSSAGGQLEHPSDVNSSTRTGERVESAARPQTAARANRIAATAANSLIGPLNLYVNLAELDREEIVRKAMNHPGALQADKKIPRPHGFRCGR